MRNITGFQHSPVYSSDEYSAVVYKGSFGDVSQTPASSVNPDLSGSIIGVGAVGSRGVIVVKSPGTGVMKVVMTDDIANTRGVMYSNGSAVSLASSPAQRVAVVDIDGTNAAIVFVSGGFLSRIVIDTTPGQGGITASAEITDSLSFSAEIANISHPVHIYANRNFIGISYWNTGGFMRNSAILGAQTSTTLGPVTSEILCPFGYSNLSSPAGNTLYPGVMAIDEAGNAAVYNGYAIMYDAQSSTWTFPTRVPNDELVSINISDAVEVGGKFSFVSVSIPRIGKQYGLGAVACVMDVVRSENSVHISMNPDGILPIDAVQGNSVISAYISSNGSSVVIASNMGEYIAVSNSVPYCIAGTSANISENIPPSGILSVSISGSGQAEISVVPTYGSVSVGDAIYLNVSYNGSTSLYSVFIVDGVEKTVVDEETSITIRAIDYVTYRLQRTTATSYTEIGNASVANKKCKSGNFYMLSGSGVSMLNKASLDLWGAKPGWSSGIVNELDVTNGYGAHQPTFAPDGDSGFTVKVPGTLLGTGSEMTMSIYGHVILSSGGDAQSPDATDYSGTLSFGVRTDATQGYWHVTGSWPYVYSGKIPCTFRGALQYDTSGSYPLSFSSAVPSGTQIKEIRVKVTGAGGGAAFYIERIEVSGCLYYPTVNGDQWAYDDSAGTISPEPKNATGIMPISTPMYEGDFTASVLFSRSTSGVSPSTYGGEIKTGIAFWVNDILNYWAVYTTESTVAIERVVDGKRVTIASSPINITSQDTGITVKYSSGKIDAYVGDGKISITGQPNVSYSLAQNDFPVFGDKIGLFYSNTCEAFMVSGASTGSSEIGIVPGYSPQYSGSGKAWIGDELVEFSSIEHSAQEYGPFQVRNVNFFPGEYTELGNASPGIECSLCRWDNDSQRPAISSVFMTPGYYATVDNIEWRPKYNIDTGTNVYRRDRCRIISSSVPENAYCGVDDRVFVSGVMHGVKRGDSILPYGSWAILSPGVSVSFKRLSYSRDDGSVPTVWMTLRSVATLAGVDVKFADRAIGDMLNGVTGV